MYFFLRADSSFSAWLSLGYDFGAKGVLVFHSKIIELFMKLLSKLFVFFRALFLQAVWLEGGRGICGVVF